jgi:hypothetical protein
MKAEANIEEISVTITLTDREAAELDAILFVPTRFEDTAHNLRCLMQTAHQQATENPEALAWCTRFSDTRSVGDI